MITNRLLKFLTLFLLSTSIYAQEGANDATFNTADNSMGTTVDGPVDNFLVYPDGKLIIYGFFEKYNGVDSHYIVRINPDKSIDSSFNIGSALNDAITAAALQSDGKIIVAGSFTQYNGIPVGSVIRLNADGSLDASFTGSVLDSYVKEMKVQVDDKILLCGAFSTYGDVPVKKVVRLDVNGTLDTTFSLNADYNEVIDIAVQTDGKIIVPGNNGGTQIQRFNSDGSVDNSFATVYADSSVRTIAIQPDGKIVIGGSFATLNSHTQYGIARINVDGTKDTTFVEGTGILGVVTDLAIQPDGKIIFVGWIDNYGQYYSYGAMRFNADGTIDNSFDAPGTEQENSIVCVAVANNKIYIGGLLISYDDSPVNYLFSLNYDGTLDYANGMVIPTGADNPVNAIAGTGNGNMLVGGSFKHYNGQVRNRLAIINADGELLQGFNAGEGPDGSVNTILRQADGKYILLGNFRTYNGVPRFNIARVNQDGSLDVNYDLSGYFSSTTIISGGKLQADGKLVVYGAFQITYQGLQSNSYLACRFNSDGTLDQAFRLPMSYFYSGVYSPLMFLEVLTDGKMILSLDSSYNRTKIAKVNSDGSVDTSFPFVGGDHYANARDIMSDNNGKFITSELIYNGVGNQPTKLYRRMNVNGIYDSDFAMSATEYGELSFIQGDGKMFFIKTNNGLTSSIKRFNTDGTPDETFGDHTIFEFSPSVNAMYCHEDKIVVGGRFSRYDGNRRGNIARFNSVGAALDIEKPYTTVQPSVIAFKNNNTVNVECFTLPLCSVLVYDLTGRLVVKANQLHDNKVSLKYAGATDSVLIVQAKLQDGSTVIKKIM